MANLQDIYDRWEAGDQIMKCSDCGDYRLESEVVWWPVTQGGMSHDEPLCEHCWNTREKRDYQVTRLRIERYWGNGVRLLVIGAICGVLWFILYRAGLYLWDAIERALNF